MPQVSPMNWMLVFFFFLYLILFIKKKIMSEIPSFYKKNMMK